MSVLAETYTLANSVEIPKLGLGTWFIDTAQAYGNERGVGEGIRNSGAAREDLFVSTKLAAEIKDYDAAIGAIDGSLETLGLDFIDLMLIHSPQPWDDFRGGDYTDGNRQAWKALEEAHGAGTIRSIGVSNFLQSDLGSLLETAEVVPHVNQVLVHAGNTPTELLAYCQEEQILVEAYSPIGHGAILENADVLPMAEKYGVSVPQLCIRYTLQLGTVSLPKTANPEHMRTNAQVDFEINEDDMGTLKDLHAQDYGEHAAFPVYSGK